jgi:hypothetical protein
MKQYLLESYEVFIELLEDMVHLTINVARAGNI